MSKTKGGKHSAIIFGVERTQNCKSRKVVTQVSAVQSEKLLFRGGGGHCRDSQLVKMLRKSE